MKQSNKNNMKQSSRTGFLTQSASSSSSLFSISPGVQLPFVGRHDSSTRPQQSSHSGGTLLSNSLFSDKQMTRSVSKQMLHYTGVGLVFSPDVVSEWSMASSYPHRYGKADRLFLPSPAAAAITKNKSVRRRRNKTTTKVVTTTPAPQIIKPHHHRPTIKQVNNATETSWVKMKEGDGGGVYVKSKMIGSCSSSTTPQLKNCPPHNLNKRAVVTQEMRWDETVLHNVSQETANHIVVLQNTCNDRVRLEKLVNNLFGQNTSDTATTQDSTADNDPEVIAKKLKVENDRLKMERKHEEIKSLRRDPFLNNSLSQYYNLPRYVRKHRQRYTDYSDVNKTCQNIEVKSVESVSTTINLQQFFNKKINKTILPTHNDFEIKMLTGGATQLHDATETNKIKMSDNSEFQLHLQQVYPQDRTECVGGRQPTERNVKGRLRWKMKPTQLDKQAGFNQHTDADDGGGDVDEVDESQTCGQLVDNQPLVYAIESWRTTWKLSNNWHDIKLADIMIDLGDIHDVVRFSAMSTCVAASLYSIPRGKQDISAFGEVMRTKHASEIWSETMEEIYATEQPSSVVGHLPPILIDAARDKLTDPNKRVQLAAAMALHACGCGNDVTLAILEHHLQYGLESDQMAAAQLIALRGEPKAKVVQQMVNFLLEGEEEVEQATALLVHLSQYTRLVHSLLAEQLNNSNWKVRSTVCDVLGNVKGQINRDLVNKLKKMMSQDWNSEVRRAAARVLGKTGNGAAIHYELRDKLLRGSERECVEALRTIAHINIMTASLLSAFLQCFSSDYMAVRIESCSTAAKMKMKNEKIIVQLIRLVEDDYSWKVKAHAIKAMSYIGLVNTDVVRTLLYALTFDVEAAVRLESCVAIHILMCNTPQVVKVVQERLQAEEDDLVIEEMRNCLRSFGVGGDSGGGPGLSGLELIIKKEVERICSKNSTTNKIILYEREEERMQIEKLMIGNRPNDDVTKVVARTTPNHSALHSSRYNNDNEAVILKMIDENDEEQNTEQQSTEQQNREEQINEEQDRNERDEEVKTQTADQ